MSFTKVVLLVAALATSVSFANQEDITYTCSIQNASITTISVAFERDSGWGAGWDWDTQPAPSFTSSATITISGMEQSGRVEGILFGGYTRLAGYAQIIIMTQNQGILTLSLMEDPQIRSAFGHGVYQDHEELILSCTISVSERNN